TGEGIHAADMGIEQVHQIGGITPQFGIKVNTSGLESAVLQHHQHGPGDLPNISRKLVGVPAVLVVAAVGIDAAEQAGIGGNLQLVLKGMAGQDGVVHFQVYLKITGQIVFAQEAND